MGSKLAITCGDPAGIGPEIIAAWLAAHPDQAGGVAVIGPARWLEGLPAAAAIEVLAVGLEDFAASLPGRSRITARAPWWRGPRWNARPPAAGPGNLPAWSPAR